MYVSTGSSETLLEYPICCGNRAEITKAMIEVLMRWKLLIQNTTAHNLDWMPHADLKGLTVIFTKGSRRPLPQRMGKENELDSDIGQPFTMKVFEVAALREIEEKTASKARKTLCIDTRTYLNKEFLSIFWTF